MLAVMTLAAPAVVSLGSATWAYGVTGTETWTSEAPKVLEEDITVDSGDNLTISSGDHSTTGQLELKNGGNASMSGGTLDAGSLRIHNAGTSTTETFTLSKGTINLSGTGVDNNSTILVGHWGNGTGVLTVEGGTLNALNGRMTIGWDSHGKATISGGVVNVGTVMLRKTSGSFISLNGGRLNVGSGGISLHNHTSGSGSLLNLLSGTLGSLHAGDMAVTIPDITVGKITVDTDVWDAATGATATGDKAGVANIKLLGNLTASEGGMTITLAGAGSLTVSDVLNGTVTLASGSTAKLVFDAGTDFSQSSEVTYEGASTDKSGFVVTARIAAEDSTFYNDKVYIAGNDTAVSVSDGVANFSGMLNTFYVNDEQSYTIAADSRAGKFVIHAGGSLNLTSSIAATFNSSGYIVNRGTLNLGSGEYTAAANGSIQGNVTMGQGAALTSSASGSIQGNVTVGNGATLTFAHSSGGVGNVYGHVTVENGGKLIFTTTDVTGYDGGANATTITVNRGGILELNRGGNETYAGTLTLNGTLKAGDGISNAMWDLFGGNASIVVSENENASIESVELRLRGSDRYVDVRDNAQLTISGKINNAAGGNNVFIKKGNGTLVLNGMYSASTLKVEAGTMTLNGGTNQQMLKNVTINGRLNVESTDAFSYSNDGTVNVSGGTLALNARQTVDSGNNVILTAGRIIGDGGRYPDGGYDAGFDVHNGSDFKITSTGASEVATGIGLRNASGNVVFNVESDKLGVSGVVAGVGGLKKEGNGTLMLTANNTYSGATTITAGTLQIGDGGAVSGTSGISIAEGAALEFVGKTDKTVTQAITGAGSVTMSGFGTVTLSGNVGTAADALGALKVNSGTLALQGTSYVADVSMNGGCTIENTGTLTLSGVLGITSTAALTPTGNVEYTGGTVKGNGFASGGSYYVIRGGTIKYTDSFSLLLNGVELGTEATAGNYYTQGADSLCITLAGASKVFSVFSGSETVSDGSAAATAESYYVAKEGRLVFDGSITNTFTKSITGTGTVAVTVGKNTDGSHSNKVVATDFNGVLEISASGADQSGNVDLSTFELGANASFKLVSGNHWSNSNTVISRDILLAGENEEAFAFKHKDTLELAGVISGTYLTAGRNYNDNADNNLILSGAGSNIQHVKMKGGSLTVNADMAFGTINAPSVTVAEDVTLTIGTGETSTSQITSLSAAGAALVLANGTTLSLAGGTEESKKIHTLGSMTQGAGSVLSLGDYSTLKLYMPAETAFAANTSISDPILSLTLAGGGTGTVLELGMDSHFEHTYNNTVKLTSANEATKAVEVVKIASGFLANTVHTGSSATDLDGADLVLADGANLVVRKGGEVNFGAGSITLEGTSDLYLYGSVYNSDTTITNDISGGTLRFKDSGEATLTGNINLTALVNDGDSNEEMKFTGATVHAGTVKLADGKTFTFGDGDGAVLSEVSFDTVNVASGTATIKLNSDATLTFDRKAGGDLKLSGNGTYNMGSNIETSVTGLNDSANWTGTVVISNYSASKPDIRTLSNTLGNSNSTLELNGVKGYFRWEKGENLATLKLTNLTVGDETYALKLDDGSSSSTMYIQNKVIGDGHMRFTRGESGTFEITGDLSEWGGQFVDACSASKEVTLRFYGDGSTEQSPRSWFKAGSDGGVSRVSTTSTLNVEIGRDNTQHALFNGSITGANKVTTRGVVEFANQVKVSTMEVSDGSTVKMSNTLESATVNLSTATVSGKAETGKLTMSKVEMSSTGISGTEADARMADAHVDVLQLANAAAFSISDLSLSNVSVSAATADTAVNLTNVTSSAVLLAQGRFTMTNQAVVDFHGVEGSKACFTTDLLSGITLNNAGNAASLSVDLGDLADVADLQDGKTYDLSITLSGFTMMNYEDGIGLVFSADSWLGQLLAEHGATEYVSGSLETPEAVASTSSVKVTYTDGGANVGTIVTITGLGEVVPEPASATLSLAALMMLCARRRRRA